MQIDIHNVREPLPCLRTAQDAQAIKAACQGILRAKASSLLAAGKAQLISRQPYQFKPQANSESMDCFGPLQPQT